MNGAEIEPLTLYAYTGSHYSDEVQQNLFDGNVRTKYCGPFSSDSPLYLFIDAGAEVTLSGYRLTTANDTKNNPDRNPVSWSLLGTNIRTERPDDKVWVLLDRREEDTTLEAVNYEPFDFLLAEGEVAVTAPEAAPAALTPPFDVYTADGRMVRRRSSTLQGLPRGLYLLRGPGGASRRVVVR